ncbi:GNAT family N-acetyltransferase [Winogradskyella sp. A3E31]|uniref:GNAT family N-acetyltransferase n=1 Tax=Winogradskyella sp. A3E31 TaxID=3349637 RepID=UPI00398B2F60
MLKIIKSNSKNEDFIALVKELDSYLKITDGDEHEFYNQFNSIESLRNVVVAYLNDKPVGCGAFKIFDKNSVEIKRMFTKTEARNKGIASKILNSLEEWAKELGFTHAILETGIRQKEAVEFYKKNNYESIPKYGQYKGMDNSLCFKKHL